MYNYIMRCEWDPDKNDWLKRERGISFEQVVFHLLRGNVWKIADHPDRVNYPGQRIYFVVIEDCVYAVPHVIANDRIFLKTIIPSRKATKMYREERGTRE